MKTNVLIPVICLVLGLSMPVTALAGEVDWLGLLGSDVRARKAAIIEESMGLSPEDAEVFRPIYRAYEQEYERIDRSRVELMQYYSKNYSAMSEKKARGLADSWFLLQDDKLGIEKKYYRKMQKALSAGLAARFVHLSHQLELLISLQITSELPLIKPGG